MYMYQMGMQNFTLFWSLNFRCSVSWNARKLANAGGGVAFSSITVFKDFSIPTVTFKTLEISTENSRIFQTFPGSVSTLGPITTQVKQICSHARPEKYTFNCPSLKPTTEIHALYVLHCYHKTTQYITTTQTPSPYQNLQWIKYDYEDKEKFCHSVHCGTLCHFLNKESSVVADSKVAAVITKAPDTFYLWLCIGLLAGHNKE